MNWRLAAVFLVLLQSEGAAANAPFCVVTDHQSFCHYYDINSCRQAAESQYGAAMCAANPEQNSVPRVQLQQPAPTTYQPLPRQQAPMYDIAEGMRQIQEAGERGRLQGQANAEHRERMRLLEAQQEQVRLQNELLKAQLERERAASGDDAPARSPSSDATPVPTSVEYKCVSPQGAISYAASPLVGSECSLTEVTNRPTPERTSE